MSKIRVVILIQTIIYLIYSPSNIFAGEESSAFQTKQELRKKIDKYYLLAENSYLSNPDSALYYTIVYLETAMKLKDKRTIADALYWTGDIYYYYDLDSALKYSQLYLEAAKETRDTSWIAYGHYLLGSTYREYGRLDLASEHLLEALEFFKIQKDSVNIGSVYNDLGYTVSYGKEQIEGLRYFMSALKLAEAISDTILIADISSNMAYYFATIEDFDNAYKYSERSLENTIELGDSLNSLIAYADLAEIFLEMGRTEKASAYIDTSKSFTPKVLSPYDKANMLSLYAELYLVWEKPEDAEEYLLSYEEILNKYKNPLLNAYYERQIGIWSFQQKNYREAIAAFENSINTYKSIDAIEGLVELYSYKGRAYAKLKEFKNAYRSHTLSDSIRKSFKYEKISQLLAERETEIEMEIKNEQDRILSVLENERLQTKELQSRSRLKTLSITIVLLVITITITIFFIITLRRKNLKLSELNKLSWQQKNLLEENLKKLELSSDELRRSNLTKDRLFSIIGHDLKSPLSTISEISDLYLHKGIKFSIEDLDPFFDSLKSTAEFGHNLLENLLQWSLINTGDLVIKPEKISFNSALDEILPGLKLKAESKKILFSLNTDTDVLVLADRNMLYTILRNLIDNAIKFSHKRDRIVIQCKESPKEAIIRIADQGIGMSEDIIQSILSGDDIDSRFGTNNEKGSGLGLRLCKDFVQRNHGRFWLESDRGKGSVFSFTLPLAGHNNK